MPALEIHSEWAKTLAEQLVASGDAPPAGLGDDERLALAWALKDLAIAAWTSAPKKVPRIRTTLDTLCEDGEIEALSAWVSGISELTKGRTSQAIPHLDDASVRFRSLGQRANAAHVQASKIMALSLLGEHAEAAECGSKILRELIELQEFHAAGKVSLNLGNLQCHRDEYALALDHFQEASKLFTQVGDREWSLMCEIGTANAHASLGSLEDALRIYMIAATEAKQHGYQVLVALVEENVAIVYLARGQYREALAGLEGSRKSYEALAMPQHLATAEKQLADAYLELQLLPEALTLFDQAVASFDSLQMPVEQAWALVQRSRTLAAMERPFHEISVSLGRATELFAAQGLSTGMATVLLSQAECALLADDVDGAVELAGDASKLFAEGRMTKSQTQAEIICAYALLKQGDISAAAEHFADSLDQARELQLLTIQVQCLVGLGLISQKRGDPVTACEHFESAIKSFEEQRRVLPSDDLRHSFLANYMRPYQELLRIELAVDTNGILPTRGAGRVLMRLERFRARALCERLGEERTPSSDNAADELSRALRARLSWVQRRAQKLLDDGENNEALVSDARHIELQLLEKARRSRLTVPTIGTSAESADINVGVLSAALDEHSMIIEYGVLDDELFACIVARSGVTLRRYMAKWSDLAEAIYSARFQIETLRNSAGKLNKHLDLLTRRSRTALRRVYDLIWAPLSDLLMGCHRVLVVPYEQLGSVPFSALHDGEQYLSQRYEISVAPSARVALRGLGRQPLPPRRAVILGESSRLVHAVEEAQFVASLFDEATVLTGQDANGDALRAASTQADVLHLACHGQFRSDNPMFSALHLVDGPFTVQDAEALRLPQGIVVLSACESGVATASKGDEVIGLVRAFLIAGAARVVASLWPVDDAVTTEFMAAFYSSLRAGAAPAAALRSAQLEVMKTHPHPFHWAAFTVYGGW